MREAWKAWNKSMSRLLEKGRGSFLYVVSGLETEGQLIAVRSSDTDRSLRPDTLLKRRCSPLSELVEPGFWNDMILKSFLSILFDREWTGLRGREARRAFFG